MSTQAPKSRLSILLESHRQARGWSKQDLADHLLIKMSTLTRLLSDRSMTVRQPLQERLGKLLGLSKQEVLDDMQTAAVQQPDTTQPVGRDRSKTNLGSDHMEDRHSPARVISVFTLSLRHTASPVVVQLVGKCISDVARSLLGQDYELAYIGVNYSLPLPDDLTDTIADLDHMIEMLRICAERQSPITLAAHVLLRVGEKLMGVVSEPSDGSLDPCNRRYAEVLMKYLAPCVFST